MTPIRPSALPPTLQASATQPSGPDKLSAQRAFFAALNQAPTAAPRPAAAPVAAPEARPSVVQAAPVIRTAPAPIAAPAEGAGRTPRPGSLFDIRV